MPRKEMCACKEYLKQQVAQARRSSSEEGYGASIILGLLCSPRNQENTAKPSYTLGVLKPPLSLCSMICLASSIIPCTISPSGLISFTNPALSPAMRAISSKSPVASGVGGREENQ